MPLKHTSKMRGKKNTKFDNITKSTIPVGT